MALCFSESSLRYDIKHTSTWDSTTVGICGIKPEFWRHVIGDINPNSLYAGSLVIKHLLERYDYDLESALRHYKGAKTSMKGVNIALNIYNKIK